MMEPEELEAVLRSRGKPVPGMTAARQLAVFNAFLARVLGDKADANHDEALSHVWMVWAGMDNKQGAESGAAFEYRGVEPTAAFFRSVYQRKMADGQRAAMVRGRAADALAHESNASDRTVVAFPGVPRAESHADEALEAKQRVRAGPVLEARLLAACPGSSRPVLERFLALRKHELGLAGAAAVPGTANTRDQVRSRGRKALAAARDMLSGSMSEDEAAWLALFMARPAREAVLDREPDREDG